MNDEIMNKLIEKCKENPDFQKVFENFLQHHKPLLT
jgi:hypothetical protein